MKSRWSDKQLKKTIDSYAPEYGVDVATRVYTSQLLGQDSSLVLHGGGNTSVKGSFTSIFGEKIAAIYVKGSGWDMATSGPEGFVAMELDRLQKLSCLRDLPDEEMFTQFRLAMLRPVVFNPSIETLAHAWIKNKFVDHTHANAILALTNQKNGELLVKEALGDDILIRPYCHPGFGLSHDLAVSQSENPDARAVVLMHHGLFTFDDDPRISYETHIDLVNKAATFARKRESHAFFDFKVLEKPKKAVITRITPVIRGLLARKTGDADRPYAPVILKILQDEETLKAISHLRLGEILSGPVLTADFLIRTKPWLAVVSVPDFEDDVRLKTQIKEVVLAFERKYRAYYEKGCRETQRDFPMFNPKPRALIIPGIGIFCSGDTLKEAEITADLVKATLRVKTQIAAMGGIYRGIGEDKLFEMEYWGPQLEKLSKKILPLTGKVAVVTGAAGAIGATICQRLLQEGCHVSGTDLPGARLKKLERELDTLYAGRFLAVPMDVTDETSVEKAYSEIVRAFGGVDLLISNAGIAFVKSLAELEMEDFRRVQRVNVEGTLRFLQGGIKILKAQGTGGDVISISTKNVPAPGANFGAYSATKAAAHQLARVASLELAGEDIRVNNLAPDAVFQGKGRRSGLWEVCGPDRMKARGLNEKGLEDYYKNRNLLKIQVTADHVAHGVIFFATRQTPTTGITLPIDGGLPDATPR